jgi:hypothetical protein
MERGKRQEVEEETMTFSRLLTTKSPSFYSIGAAMLLLSAAVLALVPSVANAASPALDGNCSNSSSGTTVSCTLSTSGTTDLLIVEVVSAPSSGSPSIGTPTCTGSGCPTLTARTSVTSSGTNSQTETAEYYGVATAALAGVSISSTVASGGGFIVVGAFSGAYSANPFPVASPPTAASTGGSSTTPSVTLTTSQTSITVLGLEGDQGSTAEGAGAGFTTISSAAISGTGSASGEYEAGASCSAGCTIDYASSVKQWALIGDAISATAPVPELPSGFGILMVAVVASYLIIRSRKRNGSDVSEKVVSPYGAIVRLHAPKEEGPWTDRTLSKFGSKVLGTPCSQSRNGRLME